MQRFLTTLILMFLLIPCGNVSLLGIESPKGGETVTDLYYEMGLDGKINYIAFERAVNGLMVIEGRIEGIITLIDFTKPSDKERLFVLDITHRKILFHSLVSHGKGSGDKYATSFSNVSGSNKSSLGFYKTGATYNGNNGYSLRLDGLERGINDKARSRAIVVHGADYCNPSFIDSGGRLGRSLGCPAIPVAVSKEIIDTIKDGTILFIYADDKNYLANSKLISNKPIALL